MYIVIHERKSPTIRTISCNLFKEIPIASFDDHTVSAVIFTNLQPAIDYIDNLYDNSKITQMQHDSMIDNLCYEQFANAMVGRPPKTWCVELTTK